MSPRSKARRIAQAFAPRTARRMVDRSVIGRRVGRSPASSSDRRAQISAARRSLRVPILPWRISEAAAGTPYDLSTYDHSS